jgi:hypothetical protein
MRTRRTCITACPRSRNTGDPRELVDLPRSSPPLSKADSVAGSAAADDIPDLYQIDGKRGSDPGR